MNRNPDHVKKQFTILFIFLGLIEIESKYDIRFSLTALFECLQYAHTKNLISNALSIIDEILQSSIRSNNPEKMTFSMVELGKPFFDLMSKWSQNETHKSAYETIYSNIFNLFSAVVQEYLEEKTDQPVLNCAKFVKCVIQCSRGVQRGSSVKFEPSDEQNQATVEPKNRLHDEFADLFITLIARVRTADNNFLSGPFYDVVSNDDFHNISNTRNVKAASIRFFRLNKKNEFPSIY